MSSIFPGGSSARDQMAELSSFTKSFIDKHCPPNGTPLARNLQLQTGQSPSPSSSSGGNVRLFSTNAPVVLQKKAGSSGVCPVCGFDHSKDGDKSGGGDPKKKDHCGGGGSGGSGGKGGSSSGGCGDGGKGGKGDSGSGDGDKGGKGGSGSGGCGDGDKGGKGGSDSGDGGKGGKGGSGCGGCGDGGKGDGPGKGKDPDKGKDKDPKGGDCGSGGGKGGGGGMNGDDPDICPDWCTDAVAIGLGVIIVLSLLGCYFCKGSESLVSCIGSKVGCGCSMNKNLAGFLNNSGKAVRGGIPDHLKDQYAAFKKAASNKECLLRYSDKCPGLVNYAGTLAGASVLSTRDTENFQNLMLCRCRDSDKLEQVCDPNDSGDCYNCKCDSIGADIVIKDEGKLIAGRCWAFSGSGKLLVGLFYPLLVTGVTLHHPPQSQLLPGFFKSAPKDFEVWGYNGTDDPDPYLLGSFQYTGKNTPSEIFVVKNPVGTKFAQVQFNFLTNHGNMNYTAVYKLEVHGLLDRSFSPQ